MAEKNISSFLTADFILLVVFIGLIFILFDLTGTFLMVHLIFFLFLVILAFISLTGIYYNMRWGWITLTFIFSLVLLDELFIYLLNKSFGTVFLISIISSLAGLILSISHIKGKHPKQIQGLSEEKLESIEKVEKTDKSADKGKYFAKKDGKAYHNSGCVIGKRIKASGQVWFRTMEEAASKGYKAHNCVKGN